MRHEAARFGSATEERRKTRDGQFPKYYNTLEICRRPVLARPWELSRGKECRSDAGEEAQEG